MSGRLDWAKARRDSEKASERARVRENKPSGQRATFKENYKPISAKQRDLILKLQREIGTGYIPPPSTSWQARDRIRWLLKIKRT